MFCSQIQGGGTPAAAIDIETISSELLKVQEEAEGEMNAAPTLKVQLISATVESIEIVAATLKVQSIAASLEGTDIVAATLKVQQLIAATFEKYSDSHRDFQGTVNYRDP